MDCGRIFWVAKIFLASYRLEAADQSKEDEDVELVLPVESSFEDRSFVQVRVFRLQALTPPVALKLTLGDRLGSLSERRYFRFINAHVLLSQWCISGCQFNP